MTSKNSSLSKAKSAKNDEFYTQYHDIEKEMQAYLDFNPDVFRHKTILQPCDDPEWSHFTKYFAQNFERFGVKKLISTSFAAKSKPVELPYQPTLFECEDAKFDQEKTLTHGKIFTLERDINDDHKIDIDDLQWRYLEGDGDFRSPEICALRDEADIIITNPPFSLFREFLAWILAAEQAKQFAIIGNMNAITYKEVFPLIKGNQMWLGNGFQSGNAFFSTPTQKNYASGVFDEQTGLVKFRNCVWFTNLEHGRRHQPLQLMSMADNRRFNKQIAKNPNAYQPYDNYHAIEVPLTNAIPSDFEGVMGVPISFLDKYNPEQFEIVSANDYRKSDLVKEKPHGLIKDKDGAINGKPTYARILIKHKQSTTGDAQ